MIKIWVDKNFIEMEGCDIPLLFPILKYQKNKLNYYHEEQVENWLKTGQKIIHEVENIFDSDFIVFPKNYQLKYFNKLKQLCKIAETYKKKVIVFYMSDVENRLPNMDNIIVFRPSMNSKNPGNEYPMPGFPEDLIKYSKSASKILVGEKPKVGYVGYYAYYNLKTKIKYYTYKVIMYIVQFKPIKCFIYLFFNYIYHNENLYNTLSVIGTGWVCRKKTIDILQKEETIEFDFIKRKKGLGIYEQNVLREEYIRNLINSDFPLAIRGFGNFSFRLSEIMSLGKIPLFIDTDCRLPFDDIINYQKYFIWVPYKDINNINLYIKHYLNKNKNNLQENQKEIRLMYEKYYTLTGYYTKIIDLLLNKLGTK